MVKEFHLIARALYSFMATLFFSGISGLSIVASLLGVGIPVFIASFIFQYVVLQPAMKDLQKPRPRLFFLIGVWVVSVSGMLITLFMLPTFEDLEQYGSVDNLARTIAMWGMGFSCCASIFVAMTCTRRAWTRYGGLG